MWGRLRSLLENEAYRAYLAWDLAFLKSGVAVVITPGPIVFWTATLTAKPYRARRVTDWVNQLRLQSLSVQVQEWQLDELAGLVTGVFAETPEQFQFALAKSGRGSRYSSIIASGMAKAWLIGTMQRAGWDAEIVFCDPTRVDKHLSGSLGVTFALLAAQVGEDVAAVVAKSMSKVKMRRRFCVADITQDQTWWEIDEKGKLVRSDDESDAAALGIVAAQMAEWDQLDQLKVSWRR